MKLIISLLLFSSIAFASPPHSQNRIIVQIKEGSSFPQTNSLIRAKNLFNNYFVAYSSDINILKSELKNKKEVLLIENDYKGTKNKFGNHFKDDTVKITPMMSPFNDPYVNSQWTLIDSEANGISVLKAFRNRRSSPKEEIVVAVVDTGVDYTHPDIPIWTNLNEVPGNGIDDDDNGYIDDIHGINTLIRDSEGNATMDVMDAHNHGTHVSGSIGAIQNNEVGIAGIASNVKIMAIRTVPNRSDETDVDVVEAFIYAAKNGAKVINCSFGKSHNEGGMAVRDAINYIGAEYGVLVVAAAGNSTRNIDMYPAYPASFDSENLLVVASTSRSGTMSYFSNYGLIGVDLAAPGSSILSSIRGGRYSYMSGTSMASPNTAGVAAEVYANYPDLTPERVKEILMNSVVKVPMYEGRIVTGGRVDLEKALILAAEY